MQLQETLYVIMKSDGTFYKWVKNKGSRFTTKFKEAKIYHAKNHAACAITTYNEYRKPKIKAKVLEVTVTLDL